MHVVAWKLLSLPLVVYRLMCRTWGSVVGVRWLFVGEHGILLSIKYLGTVLRLGLQAFEMPVS
jgi:hypothetical protein